MAYPIEKKLVVGITSSALFDFSVEHEIYAKEGVDAFRKYQIDNRKKTPAPGAAFPFIKRLLHLNNRFPDQSPIEVVILSRNDPVAGARVTDAIPEHGLDITRYFFLSGASPYPYMKAVNACLYLSANKDEVKSAVTEGHPAGYVLPCATTENELDTQLRIAFDFDGILVNDEAEQQYAKGGLDLFRHHEIEHKARPLKEGPLMPLLQKISTIQQVERDNAERVNDPDKAIRVAIVTARNAPAHERMMTTLKHHGIEVDELFLTGGIEKKNILDILRPQVFFDDQIGHLEPASASTPCVHIPFGIRNQGDLSAPPASKNEASTSRRQRSAS